MDYTITGVVTHFLQKNGVSKKDSKPFVAWAIRVEEDFGQYPNSICGEVFGEKITPPAIGEKVTVYFNPRCNVLDDGRFFGKENIWKIESVDTTAPSQNAPINAQDGVDPYAALKPDFAAPGSEGDKDDLPF